MNMQEVRLGYDIRGQDTIEGHTCPELTSDLMHMHGDFSATSHLQLISKLF